MSAAVVAVETSARSLVVKRADERFRVADEWIVPRHRALVEAASLRICAEITPDAVPALVDVDADTFTLVIERAPRSWTTWRDDLLAGWVDASVAATVGRVLASWHRATRADAEVERALAGSSLEEQRLDPFFRTVGRRRPALARALDEHIAALESSKKCLVHGDFTPKNVVHGDGRAWIVDHEIAHFGDPGFDVASLTSHLLLKAVHRPADAAELSGCLRAFSKSYGPVAKADRVISLAGALIVARVVGKSPAPYLDTAECEGAERFGTELLLEPPGELCQVMDRLEALHR